MTDKAYMELYVFLVCFSPLLIQLKGGGFEMKKQKLLLRYDRDKWEEKTADPVNTLQMFITNRCNKRCNGCFYAHKLGVDEMSVDTYKRHLDEHLGDVDRITLLGGEPTIHRDLGELLDFNRSLGLKTTIYTNGFDLERLEDMDMSDVSLRVGVYGATSSEKPLTDVQKTSLPMYLVYMLRRDNVDELAATAEMGESEFDCKAFYISSIRDIEATQDFWKDTGETLPMSEYFEIVQDFVSGYDGEIPELHIARRGIIFTDNTTVETPNCRFGNIFPDGEKIICPLDISKKITTPKLVFNKRPCNKNDNCILRKVVLKRKS